MGEGKGGDSLEALARRSGAGFVVCSGFASGFVIVVEDGP